MFSIKTEVIKGGKVVVAGFGVGAGKGVAPPA